MTDRPGLARAWTAAALSAAFIFLISSVSRPFPADPAIMRWHLDWVFHAAEFAFFGYFLTRAFSLTYNFRSVLILAVLVMAAGTLYGVSDEWHQTFVPGRESDPADVVADAAGVAAGFVVWLKLKKGSASHA